MSAFKRNANVVINSKHESITNKYAPKLVSLYATRRFNGVCERNQKLLRIGLYENHVLIRQRHSYQNAEFGGFLDQKLMTGSISQGRI